MLRRLIVALFLVFGHLNKMNEYTHNEEYPLYQYFAGQKNTYTGKVTISKNKDITEIKNDDGVVGIEDAPIYFQKSDDEVLVSKNMLLVFPRIIIHSLVNSLSIFNATNNTSYVSSIFLIVAPTVYAIYINKTIKE